MNYQQQLANSAAIRAEIQRFESVHPNIYSIYELLERLEEPVLQSQIREHVIAIEGEPLPPRRLPRTPCGVVFLLFFFCGGLGWKRGARCCSEKLLRCPLAAGVQAEQRPASSGVR